MGIDDEAIQMTNGHLIDHPCVKLICPAVASLCWQQHHLHSCYPFPCCGARAQMVATEHQPGQQRQYINMRCFICMQSCTKVTQLVTGQ